MTEVELGGRAVAAELIADTAEWAPRDGAVYGLHVGDIGWHLRLDDADLDGTLLAVRDAGSLVAAGLFEPGFLRLVLRPDRVDDDSLAAELTDLIEEGYVDCAAPAVDRAFRAVGWVDDPDPWAVLYRPLTDEDGRFDEPLARPLGSETNIADRVAVQHAAFERSTFTVPRWHQMAASPAHQPALEFLLRNSAGLPVAAATGWSAGPGRTGILEPVGTHPEHRQRGHGRTVSLAVIAALAHAGASGVTVQTPESNTGALHTYLSCGLEQVASIRALMHPASTQKG